MTGRDDNYHEVHAPLVSDALNNISSSLADLERPVEHISDAITSALTSPNEMDRNLEPANVVDGLFAIARGLQAVADAIRDKT